MLANLQTESYEKFRWSRRGFGRCKFIVWLVLTSAFVSAKSTSATPMQLAYVANSNDNSVSVISLATRQLIGTIQVGLAPTHVAVSPDGRRAYVSNRDSSSVSIIDTMANSIVGTVAVGNMPSSLALSRDGGHVYVTNSGSATISIIDTQTKLLDDTINTSPGPNSIAFHPIRDEVWVGFSPPGSVGRVLEVRSAVDNAVLATKNTKFDVISPLSRIWAGTDLVFREDGSEAFGVEGCGQCGRFHRILGAHAGGLIGIVDQDLLFDNTGAAMSAAINPIDGTAYLGKLGQGFPHRIQEFGGLGRTLNLSMQPSRMAVSPDGAFLYVVQTAATSGFIDVVDTTTFTIVDSINVGASPAGIAIAMIDTSGDFNRNGTVDAADYVVWRKGLGTTYTQNDYNLWRAHFGESAGSAILAVPEPPTWAMLMFAAVGICVLSRRAA